MAAVNMSDVKMITAIFLIFAVVDVSDGHLCLINPQQRGVMGDLNVKASDGCFQTEEPCGKVPVPERPTSLYWTPPGEIYNLTVIFQKNLDHYSSTTPGYFSVALGTLHRGGAVSFKEVGRIADTSTPSLHLYTMTVAIPNVVDQWYVLQVSYVTNNPQAPAAFYQCTDFVLVTNSQ